MLSISDKTDFECLRTMLSKIVDDQFESLGITATLKYSNLLKSNWDTKIQQLHHNIDLWNTLPISLIGRLNTIKMVTLPRFLYFFQCLPVDIQIYYFKKSDSIISSFIWSNKVARISKKHSCKNKYLGWVRSSSISSLLLG